MARSRLSTLTYPTRLPSVPRGPDPSDDFQATEADYVKFSRVHFKNKGGPQYFNVPGNVGKGGKDIIQTAKSRYHKLQKSYQEIKNKQLSLELSINSLKDAQ